jgi:septin family protein
MKITESKYLTSVVEKSKLLTEGTEFAFVGRSNVGKSTFINSLVNSKKLCKTSSMPGRTRMVNYFLIKLTTFSCLEKNLLLRTIVSFVGIVHKICCTVASGDNGQPKAQMQRLME